MNSGSYTMVMFIGKYNPMDYFFQNNMALSKNVL
jgi:hypothetical protein